MYVCICHGITERQIQRAVEHGARSLGEVQMHLPVAGCCGRCEDCAREVIRECQSRKFGAATAVAA
ncbi:MAG TPA: (2Fe-2S)-binding protein [Steroidobacteraceae bacterium]|jgi:bacterioferritin-associated ferredoxin